MYLAHVQPPFQLALIPHLDVDALIQGETNEIQWLLNGIAGGRSLTTLREYKKIKVVKGQVAQSPTTLAATEGPFLLCPLRAGRSRYLVLVFRH
jgi:hypothetical protein